MSDNQSYILNIETATENCSVTISQDSHILSTIEDDKSYVHASLLSPFIDEALHEAQIDYGQLSAVAVSIGPGSYTGLRVGLATAKAIAYSLDIPIISIPSLEIIAAGMMAKHQHKDSFYMPMIDARRMEVYTSIYSNKFHEFQAHTSLIITEETIINLASQFRHIIIGGNGAEKVFDFINEIPQMSGKFELSEIKSSSKDMIILTKIKFHKKLFSNVFTIVPQYLKPPNITHSKKTLLK